MSNRFLKLFCGHFKFYPDSESTMLKEKKRLQPSSSDNDEPAGRNGKS
jgi:hypothetical protein